MMHRAAQVTVAGIGATLALTAMAAAPRVSEAEQPQLGTRTVPVIMRDGLRFRDLDRDRQLSPFEDWRQSPLVRAEDLARRLTIEEKAGLMMHGSAPAPGSPEGAGQRYDLAAARDLIDGRKVLAFITRLAGEPRILAEENNRLQAIAEAGRFAIPVTISSDPRSSLQGLRGVSIAAGGFSKWPDAIGLAAARDPQITRHFAQIVRQEYRAVGIGQALSPTVDLSTEPRWPRIASTFGEDADLSSRLGAAYVEGMQDGTTGLHPGSVAAVVKHWVGTGASANGYDSHNIYGRFSNLDDRSLANHMSAFTGAFAANVSGVMPAYSVANGVTVRGRPLEAVGAGYNTYLLRDVLRKKQGFAGVVLSDWLITEDCTGDCVTGAASGRARLPGGMPWGVEALDRPARYAKAVAAGVDQFGGVQDPADLLSAIADRRITVSRIDRSVVRILEQKFALGLFENPFVDPDRADILVGSASNQAAGDAAQRAAVVLLKNDRGALPARRGSRAYLVGFDPVVARARGLQPVDRPEDADIALVRAEAPYDSSHPGYFFGSRHHEGALSFPANSPALAALRKARGAKRVIAFVQLDRPAVLAALVPLADAVIADFAATDGPLLDVALGKAHPIGKLPFELPSSDAAVAAQRPDRPHDSARPLYPFGFGLSYR